MIDTFEQAKAEAIKRYGGLAWVKKSPHGLCVRPDGSVRDIAFHEVFCGSEGCISRWGIGENWDEAFSDCERRGELTASHH